MALTSLFCQVHKLLRVKTLKMHPFLWATRGSMRELGVDKRLFEGHKLGASNSETDTVSGEVWRGS